MNEPSQDQPSETPEPKQGVRYRTTPEGQTFRSAQGGPDEHICDISPDGDVTFVNQDLFRYRPAVLRHYGVIGRTYKNVTTRTILTEAVEALSNQNPVIAPAGVLPPPETAPSVIPPAPKLDKMAGDKTPAYVEWLARYHPEKFRERYGVIEEGEYEESKAAVRGGRLVRETIKKRGLIAARATHMTAKIRGGNQ